MKRRHRANDDYWMDAPFHGFGLMSDLRDCDPRNPNLAGLKSVSYAAAVAIRKPTPPRQQIGFHRPKR